MSCYFYFAERVFSGMAVYRKKKKFSFPRTVGPMVRTRLLICFLYLTLRATVYINVGSVCQTIIRMKWHPKIRLERDLI